MTFRQQMSIISISGELPGFIVRLTSFTSPSQEACKAAASAAGAPAAAEPIDFSKVKIEPLFTEYVDFETFSKSDFRAVKVKECVAVPK